MLKLPLYWGYILNKKHFLILLVTQFFWWIIFKISLISISCTTLPWIAVIAVLKPLIKKIQVELFLKWLQLDQIFAMANVELGNLHYCLPITAYHYCLAKKVASDCVANYVLLLQRLMLYRLFFIYLFLYQCD